MMRTRSRQHRRLASLDLFAGCTADQINLIDRLTTEVLVPAGTPVWDEGRTEPQFIVMLEGHIDLTRGGDHVATLNPGAWFGHVALLAHLSAEEVSGVVVSQTRLLAFSKREFASLLHAVPTVLATLQHPAAPTVAANHPRNEVSPVQPQRTSVANAH